MFFSDLFIDVTKFATKLPTSEYNTMGKHPIIDQGQKQIAGYTDLEEGLFTDVPAIIFGDHTRVIKYIDTPFFIGADGVKVIKCLDKQANYNYLYYLLSSVRIPNTGYNRHYKWLKEAQLVEHTKEEQEKIVSVLSTIDNILNLCFTQINKLDELIKSRFVEMFGDIKLNPYKWDIVPFSKLTDIITDGEHATPKRVTKGIYLLSARNVLNHELQLFDVDYISEEEYRRISKRIIPRNGDVLLSCSGSVGRCCVVPNNIKFQMVRSVALLRFKNTINPVFAEYLITSDFIQDQINSNKTASSQANLFQGKIAKLNGINPPQQLQNQFADFVTKIDQQKATVQKSIDKLETLKKSLMQEYFG